VTIDVDLYSDTITRPTAAMRKAMAAAEVGDEQTGEDPTVNRLQERVAALLGHEAGLYLPSGTMANQIALRVHCRPGDEVLAHPTAHTFNFESGGPSANAGVSLRALDGPRGQYSVDQLEPAIRPQSRFFPRSRLVWVEQTSNLGGGTIWPLATIHAIVGVAHERGLVAHLDGARLLNASVAAGNPPSSYAVGFDSAWLDLTKGLGAPVGAVLVGPSDFIAEAWRYKQQMGGAMRQAGIIAAAGLYALDHHVDRLVEDHDNARHLAEGLAALPEFDLDPADVETNMVFFRLHPPRSADAFVAAMLARGVRMSALGDRVRAVTHLDVDRASIDHALDVAASVVAADAAG
jgi:threonine aldolase